MKGGMRDSENRGCRVSMWSFWMFRDCLKKRKERFFMISETESNAGVCKLGLREDVPSMIHPHSMAFCPA